MAGHLPAKITSTSKWRSICPPCTRCPTDENESLPERRDKQHLAVFETLNLARCADLSVSRPTESSLHRWIVVPDLAEASHRRIAACWRDFTRRLRIGSVDPGIVETLIGSIGVQRIDRARRDLAILRSP